MKPRILLVDDHEIIRAGLRTFLEVQSRWDICGEASNGKEAVDKAMTLRPDLVVLDLTMPVMNGLQAAREIRQIVPGTKIVMFTMHDSSQVRTEALRVGADACLAKTAPSQELIAAITALLDHANG